jgi:pSer/pThr/pTyr-binding forkhead associated (FHA) protein
MVKPVAAASKKDIRAVLHLRLGEQEHTFFLREETTVQIGRDDDNDITVNSELISRRHAVLTWKSGTFELRDLGSRNGTLVNGQICQTPVLLQEADVIDIGTARFTFSLVHLNEPAPSPDSDVVVEATMIEYPRLVVCTGPRECHKLEMTRHEVIIGRSKPEDSWDLSLPDPSISKPHASVSYRNKTYILTDLGSRNGSYVNETLIDGPTILKDGDVIRLGATTMLVRMPSSLVRAPAEVRDVLSDSAILAIVESKHLIARNLQITLSYYRLSQAMQDIVSSDDLNWCSFATYASKTAGQVLRHELIPRPLKSFMIRAAGYDDTSLFHGTLGDNDQEALDEADNYVGKVLRKVTRFVSEGNLMVFAELSRPFASFVRSFADNAYYDEAALQQFLREQFQPGSLEAGGQDHLIEAFTAYYQARFEPDRKLKAEHMLLGNLLVGLHEQIRLQPYIEQALAVPIDLLFEGHVDVDTHEAGISDLIRKRAKGLSRRMVIQSITQMLMTISLPTRKLKLGDNVVVPTGVTASWPRDLLVLNDPRLRTLVREFDAGLNTVSDSAAGNWASLVDRMNFIVDFFRSHQKYRRLFQPPFKESQIPTIDAGEVPPGLL